MKTWFQHTVTERVDSTVNAYIERTLQQNYNPVSNAVEVELYNVIGHTATSKFNNAEHTRATNGASVSSSDVNTTFTLDDVESFIKTNPVGHGEMVVYAGMIGGSNALPNLNGSNIIRTLKRMESENLIKVEGHYTCTYDKPAYSSGPAFMATDDDSESRRPVPLYPTQRSFLKITDGGVPYEDDAVKIKV